jgi:hypothetical protein
MAGPRTKPAKGLRVKNVQAKDLKTQQIMDSVQDLANQMGKLKQGPQGPQGARGPMGPAGSGSGGGILVGRAQADDGGANVLSVDTGKTMHEALVSTDGVSIATVSYAAVTAGNKIRVRGFFAFASGGSNIMGLIADDTTAVRAVGAKTETNDLAQMVLEGEFAVADTASHTYDLRLTHDTRNSACKTNWDQFDNLALLGGQSRCWIEVSEYTM